MTIQKMLLDTKIVHNKQIYNNYQCSISPKQDSYTYTNDQLMVKILDLEPPH